MALVVVVVVIRVLVCAGVVINTFAEVLTVDMRVDVLIIESDVAVVVMISVVVAVVVVVVLVLSGVSDMAVVVVTSVVVVVVVVVVLVLSGVSDMAVDLLMDALAAVTRGVMDGIDVDLIMIMDVNVFAAVMTVFEFVMSRPLEVFNS